MAYFQVLCYLISYFILINILLKKMFDENVIFIKLIKFEIIKKYSLLVTKAVFIIISYVNDWQLCLRSVC